MNTLWPIRTAGRILPEKKGPSDTWANWRRFHVVPSKTIQPQKDEYCTLHSHEVPGGATCRDGEHPVGARGRGECLTGTQSLFGGVKMPREVHGRWRRLPHNVNVLNPGELHP